jgi:hypothetical protein
MWIANLSDGRIMNSKDLFYPGGKSEWYNLIDMLKDDNSRILRAKYGEKSWEELRQDYYAESLDFKPKVVRVTSIKIVIDNHTFNSASTSETARFRNKAKISAFWIFGMSDFDMLSQGNTEYISFSFMVDNDYRVYQWINVESGESWIEIGSTDDPRNLRAVREQI